MAYERYNARFIAQDVPVLAIVPTPLTKRQTNQLLGNRVNYAMIFGAESIYFQDTVHAFAVDSYCFGGVNVLGVHIDWISSDDKSAKRALTVDETGFVKEVAFEISVPIHIVQILHLPLKRERQLHRELSIRFRDSGIPQINPYEDSSERADDKSWTHALWAQYGLEIVSPKYILIPQRSSPEEIAERLRAFIGKIRSPDVVVQTNRGTEGHKVENFAAGDRLSPIVEYIKDQVLPEDDAIVRERRGNVRYRNQSSNSSMIQKIPLNPPFPKGDFRNVAFRINVAWNGSEFVAESGYAQVAKDDRTFPASRGRGGAIVDINEAFVSLYYPNGGKWIRFIPTDEDIATMKRAAINAAYGLNAGLAVEDYLKHMGIDIVLEVKKSEANAVNVIPVVLEANPRPAGLAHSWEIIGISDKRPQPRISMEIFKFVGSVGL